MPLQHQKRIKGGRLPAHASVVKELRAEVERTAHKFQVSKSFVIAVALAKAFHIPIESYETSERRLRRVK